MWPAEALMVSTNEQPRAHRSTGQEKTDQEKPRQSHAARKAHGGVSGAATHDRARLRSLDRAEDPAAPGMIP